MKLAVIQQHATTDKAQNLARGLASARAAAAAGAQVIVFAELAFEPFYPQFPAADHPWGGAARELGETIPGPTTEAFRTLACELGVVVVLNLYERDGARAFDTSPVIDADGTLLGKTRMLHITDYEAFHETGYYDPGDTGAPVYDTRFGKLGVAICYDRHYPEVTRALALAGADAILVPQAGAQGEWPDGLFEAELQVISFQNGVYCALCNRVGKEARLDFAGESFVTDPAGRVLARAASGTDEVLHADLDLTLVAASHAKRLFLRDRRPALYREW